GPQAGDRGSERAADDRLLRDRRVAHAARSEAVEEAGSCLEDAARDADVLAEQEHPLVPLELLAERPDHAFAVGELRHAKTSSKRLSRSGSPHATARSVASRTTASVRSRSSTSSAPVATPASSSTRSKRAIGSRASHSSSSPGRR